MAPKLKGNALHLGFDVAWFRAKLRKMSDAQLIKIARDLALLCSPKQNYGKRPREVWAAELNESRAEWKRRHPRARVG